MKFQQIRSATAILTYAGTRFLIDPMFAPKDTFPPIPGSPNPDLRTPLHDLPLPIAEICKVDAVILTHLHFDHFDEAAARALDHRLPIICQDKTDAASLKALGFENLTFLNFSGRVFKGIRLTKTGCHHGLPGRCEALYEAMGMRGTACGLILEATDEPKLYLVGDTIYCDYVEEALALHQPEAAVINAAGASIKGCGHIIFDLDDVKTFLKKTPKTQVIASHMDNVGHETVWREDLRSLNTPNLLIPEDGEIISL